MSLGKLSSAELRALAETVIDDVLGGHAGREIDVRRLSFDIDPDFFEVLVRLPGEADRLSAEDRRKIMTDLNKAAGDRGEERVIVVRQEWSEKAA